jgi:hypothetical protein
MPFADYYSVAFGSDKFVAIPWLTADTGAYSTDGITWATTTFPNAQSWYSIAYGNGIWVAAGEAFGVAASSTNGITWTTRTMPSDVVDWNSIIYSNNLFVAVSSVSTIAATSTNGITWTLRSAGFGSGSANAVAYGRDGLGNRLWVAASTGDVFRKFLLDSFKLAARAAEKRQAS